VKFFAEGFTWSVYRIRLSTFKCALVVGGRFLAADETGNPARIRDGPAAVTE
jgi:hypothetical protein